MEQNGAEWGAAWDNFVWNFQQWIDAKQEIRLLLERRTS
jgi:hypothetical protein